MPTKPDLQRKLEAILRTQESNTRSKEALQRKINETRTENPK